MDNSVLVKSIPLIKREQSRARMAFVKGIPTAISYDIVRVGSQYGSVFELLQARSFNDWAQEYEQDKAELGLQEDKIRVVAYIRFLHILLTTGLKESALTAVRVKHAVTHLQDLLSRVDSLAEK